MKCENYINIPFIRVDIKTNELWQRYYREPTIREPFHLQKFTKHNLRDDKPPYAQ